MQEINNNTQISLQDENKYDFSLFSNREHFELDEELLSKFKPVAKELNLSQESVEKLLDIAYQMSVKQKEKYDADLSYKQSSLIENYSKEFESDSELPSANSIQIKEYMKLADYAYSEFATPKLKKTLQENGMIYNPELIKMFHKIGELMSEDELNFNGKPIIEELTPAEILYGKSEN